MHDFACKDSSDMNYEILADRVRFFKESKEEIMIMCKAMEEMWNQAVKEVKREGKRAGGRLGIEEQKRTTVIRMLASGKYGLEEIVDISGTLLMKCAS